jgi:hypothetical protein
LSYEKERKKDMSALRKRRKRRAARGNETTHTHTQREREMQREERAAVSLSLIREETKKHSINYPPSSGPNSLRENRSKRVALSSRSTNRNLPENERQTTTRDE